MDLKETLLQRVIDGEASEEEREAFAAFAAEDPSLLEFVEGSTSVGGLLREGLHSHAESIDFEPMWARIQKDIAWHESGRERSLAAQAAAAGLSEENDVGWRSIFSRLFSLPSFAAFGAAFLVLLALPGLLEDPIPDGPVARRIDPGPTELKVAALPQFGGVEVESVESASDATVMVFQGGEGAATFIWVSENSSEETAI